ncbi:hypothetical protein EDC45_1442 [Mesocricetibacter intestinalis]|uniref:YcgL domain-containing protein EDC45_1442 n=1 Tax=Mesocricetibacter intestinalis TaxID=1521930 RepID=A0A4V3D9K6_9PAST|nr:YcgL domain-containing protein [Mesocricetibacter intestinalis]TDQ57382.1 hypothetical protein EDC45_1442 [Mesocricetibacter intestinalis]
MLCAIYKSKKKAGAYLYVPQRDNFEEVPESLMQAFGRPYFVMLFNLAGHKQLIRISNREVMERLREQGFYLQLPQQEDGLFNSLTAIR